MRVRGEKPKSLSEKGERGFEARRRVLLDPGAHCGPANGRLLPWPQSPKKTKAAPSSSWQCVEDRGASTPFVGSGSGFAAEDS